MKKITVLMVSMLMLMASYASAAVTPDFPAYLNSSSDYINGTVMVFTGFSVNATAGSVVAGTGTEQPIIPFSSNMTKGDKSTQFFFNGTGTQYFSNATVVSYNATKGQWGLNGTSMMFTFGNNTGNIVDTVMLGAKATNGAAPFNGTTATGRPFFIPAGNYQMMVGLANGTLGDKHQADAQVAGVIPAAGGPKSGLSMPMMYANGTFEGINSSSDTWDYYAYGVANEYPVMVFAQVQITAMNGDANAQVKYFVDNATSTITDNTSSWMNYNATNMQESNGGVMALTRSGGMSLFENATINVDQNMVTGYVYTDTIKLFGVMVKSGTTLSSDDVKNRGFNMIYVGSGYDSNSLGNATAGVLQFNADDNLTLAGNARVLEDGATGAQVATDASLGGFSLALASTSQFGLSQSNMTVYAADGTTVVGNFYGKQSADKVFSVGFFEDADGYRGLSFMIPTQASTTAAATAASGYQHNSTATLAPVWFTQNATGYTSVALKARWTSVPSDFTPLTDVKGYDTSVTGQKGDYYFSSQYQMSGISGKVENLRLYKLMTNSANSHMFTYASSATPSTDGSWWISTAAADGYLNPNSVLDPATSYYVTWVVKDNGTYDANSTAAGILDPVVLGSVPNSSSSSGCVFNPAAGFGLEWLLLMLAPMVAIVRSRFK